MGSLVEADAARRPNVLTLDIETRPMLAYVWGAYDQNVAPVQVVDEGGTLCAAAKWFGDPKVMFAAEWDGHQWLNQIWGWLDVADIVVTYNGDRFDLPELSRQFVVAGLGPPSPFKSVDLLRVARRRFRFPIKKLEHVATELGIGHKLATGGFQLWRDLLDGDRDTQVNARRVMKRYNVQDVKLTEEVYLALLPWVPNHPHVALFGESLNGCPHCGSEELEHVGTVPALANTYPLYRCQSCRANVRGVNQVGERPSTKGT